VFAAAGDRSSLERLFKLVVISVAVGNLDLHAKNLALLHRPDGSMTLSPAYDVVPQAHQPADGEVALAVGGEYRHAALTRGHLVAEGRGWGLTGAASLAEETLAAVLKLTKAETPHDGLMLGSPATSPGSPPICSPDTLSGRALIAADTEALAPGRGVAATRALDKPKGHPGGRLLRKNAAVGASAG
jgi:HipA-like protein